MSNTIMTTIYNHYMTTYSPKKSDARLDSHNKSELKNIYSNILKLNKEAPLYIYDRNEQTTSFALSLKENTRQLQHTILNTVGNKENDLFKNKVAFSSDDDVVSVKYIGDTAESSAENYQLMALKVQNPEYLEAADAMLMIPDFFHYKLSGKKVQEYTEATTAQLVNPETKDWDYELIDMLGFPKGIFQKILMPGTPIGNLTAEVQEIVGYDCQVVLPPTHDTAAAVMALPTNAEDTCYISSGTWSLMGVETSTPNCSEQSRIANFTNEGGYGGKITYLTNIMGLWMINSVRNKHVPEMSYGDLCEQASHETIASLVDCQDECFMAPEDMAEAVKEYCRARGQEVPETIPAVASVIYNSLAKCYAEKLQEIQKITGVTYERLNIIGGGSNAKYLNELTAKYTGIPVVAGPGEATAIGNILAQMMGEGTFANLAEARNCVAESFDVKVFE